MQNKVSGNYKFRVKNGGSATIEFILVFPVLVYLLMFAFEYSRYIQARSLLSEYSAQATNIIAKECVDIVDVVHNQDGDTLNVGVHNPGKDEFYTHSECIQRNVNKISTVLNDILVLRRFASSSDIANSFVERIRFVRLSDAAVDGISSDVAEDKWSNLNNGAYKRYVYQYSRGPLDSITSSGKATSLYAALDALFDSESAILKEKGFLIVTEYQLDMKPVFPIAFFGSRYFVYQAAVF